MEPRPLQFLARACGATCPPNHAALQISRICTDSRKAGPGDLFVALEGDRFDGHQFVPEVVGKGVAAVVVRRGKLVPNLTSTPVLEVSDTRQALGQIAAEYRKGFAVPAVAVAGSNGKTSTKELVASVLRQRFSTVWSDASFNNDIGVPFTLLKLESTHQAAVFELGTNHPGELAPLIRMVSPRFGIITSIGREHLEFFKDLEGVAREEGTLAELLPSDGVLFLEGDTEWTDRLAKRASCKVVRVGFTSGCDWRVANLKLGAGGTRFEVVHGPSGYDGEYLIRLLGRHQVVNALLAAAVGHELGISPAMVRQGLAECAPAKSRLVLSEHAGVGLLDDSYNANADSMMAALRTLRELPCRGRRIAVLGDMAELGEDTATAHRDVGRAVAESGIDQLVVVGTQSGVTASAAREGGMEQIISMQTPEETIQFLKASLVQGDIVLIKASRAAGLDRVSDALKNS